jgi:hypothetical protein
VNLLLIEQAAHAHGAVRQDAAPHGVGVEVRPGDLRKAGRPVAIHACDRHRPAVEGGVRLQLSKRRVAHLR